MLLLFHEFADKKTKKNGVYVNIVYRLKAFSNSIDQNKECGNLRQKALDSLKFMRILD